MHQNPPAPPVAPAVRVGGALAFLIGCDSMVVVPIAPEMLAGWHSSPSLAGLLVAAYALSYALTSPFLGALADHLGRRRVAVPGTVLFAAGTALTATATGLDCALVWRALAGLGAGMVMPAVFGEVSGRSSADQRGHHIGAVMGLLLASTLIGVPLGSFVSSVTSWHWVFLALAVLALLVAVPASRVFSGSAARQIAGSVPAAVARMLQAALTTPRLLLVLASTFLWNAGLAVLFSVIGAFYLDRFGFGSRAMGLVILAAGVASVVGALGGGRVLERLGAGRHLVVCAGIAAVGVLVTVLAPPVLVATIAGHVCWSLAIGAGQPALTVLAADLEPRLQGTALALNGSTQYLAQFVAASVASLVLAGGGGFTVLGVIAAALALTTALSTRLAARTGSPAHPASEGATVNAEHGARG